MYLEYGSGADALSQLIIDNSGRVPTSSSEGTPTTPYILGADLEVDVVVVKGQAWLAVDDALPLVAGTLQVQGATVLGNAPQLRVHRVELGSTATVRGAEVRACVCCLGRVV